MVLRWMLLAGETCRICKLHFAVAPGMTTSLCMAAAGPVGPLENEGHFLEFQHPVSCICMHVSLSTIHCFNYQICAAITRATSDNETLAAHIAAELAGHRQADKGHTADDAADRVRQALCDAHL